MIVRLLLLLTAAVVAVVIVKAVFVALVLAATVVAAWYAYRFIRAFVLIASGHPWPIGARRPRGVRPLARPNISVRR